MVYRSRPKRDRLTVTLGDDQRQRIASIARERRTSEATIIRWAVDEYIAGYGPDEPKRRPNGGAVMSEISINAKRDENE